MASESWKLLVSLHNVRLVSVVRTTLSLAIAILVSTSLALTLGQQAYQDDMPPDEVALLQSLEYLERGDIDAAYATLADSFAQSSRNPDPERRVQRLSQRKISLGGGLTYTSEYKLRADIEQAEYLAETLRKDGDAEKADFFVNAVLPIYQTLLERIPSLDQLDETMGLYQFQQQDVNDGIMSVYNRALHVPDVNEFRDDGSPIAIFSDSLDVGAIHKAWRETGIVVVDNVLSQEALELIQKKVMLESTVFFQTKLPKRFGGYTGAYIDDGLHHRILLKLSVDLRNKFPNIFADHPLKYMWAYK